ncbi:helix-turn-helix domain-containing protein [Caulobacter sp. 17J80-11]|uniref:winged helix-turn-helix domain-containing protein n=1 Tax=Caulobacter sp. 17J80-11 TaxID=2763502 RepID=UPI001653EA53|nr:helix-turn-helix domain-containing protein [Caulobacter sp. 17J80-11]MBC6983361.1 helix-turn-helix transcriptional regulator [Caulobacter sp. 17J80-11]
MAEPFVRRALRDPAQIRLLSSAVRQEIVDTLAALGGEASVAAMAEHLGRPADGLYYHLRALLDGGLVEEVPAGDEERRYRLAGEGDGPIRLAYDLGPQGNRRELGAFARALLQIAAEDFEAALAAPESVTEGPARELWVSRNKGWLSNDDLEEASRLLERLSELSSQPKGPGRERLMSFAFALAPLSPRPRRRGRAG